MDNLFNRLQSYAPREGRFAQEDYFTEAFCYVLEMNPETLKKWIWDLWGEHIEVINPSVQTQRAVPGRRPDVWIEFLSQTNPPCKHLILCEHKIEADQGKNQLPAYWSYLKEQISSGQFISGRLAYITRRFVSIAVDNEESPTPNAQFVKRQWKQAYNVLKANKNIIDPRFQVLADNLIEYMEELKMNPITSITSRELAGLTEVPRSIEILEACLSDIAWDAFLSIYSAFGSAGKRDDPGGQLYSYHRWSYYRVLTGNLLVNMGFYLDNTEFRSCTGIDMVDKSYPEAIVWLWSNSEKANEYGEFLRVKLNWKKGVGGVSAYASKSMRELVSEENSVKVIQEWFALMLGDLKAVMDEIPLAEDR